MQGATAFFDANFNGLIDFVDVGDEEQLGEPFVATQIDGAFALVIDEFDLDGNGLIEPHEGRFVLTGGVDISTGLPLRVPLTAPLGVANITPASTLAEALVRREGLSVDDALARTSAALGVDNYDFGRGAALYETLAGDVLAARAYNRAVQLYTGVVHVAQYLAGVTNRELLPVAQTVMEQAARLVRTDGALLNLASETTVEALLSAAAYELAFDQLPDSRTTVQQVVADSVARLDALELAPGGDGEQFLLDLYRIKKVVQGPVADALLEVGAGRLTPEALQTDYAGAALTALIDASVATVTVPPVLGVDTLAMVEGAAGESMMRFRVALVGAHDYPVSVQYASADDTAVAGEDYQSVAGTLTWEAGDNSLRYIDVPVLGDALFEGDEVFSILLSDAVGAAIREAQGYGFILNDDDATLSSAGTGPANLYVELSDERLEVSENREQQISGEFAQAASLTYVGAFDQPETVVVDVSSNSFRADRLTFDGGATPTIVPVDAASIVDALVVQGGEFGAVEYTFDGAQQATVRLFDAAVATAVTIDLANFEATTLGVSTVDTVVLRLPVAYGAASLTVDPDDATLLRLSGPEGGSSELAFRRPTDKVLVLGIGGLVDVSAEIEGLTVESALAGIHVPTVAVNENLTDVDLGALASRELGFDGAVTVELVEDPANQGTFALDGSDLQITGSIDFETTPELRTRVRLTNAAGETLEAPVTVTVNNLVELQAPAEGSAITIDDGSNQRSRIRELLVNFDQAIEFDAGAFVVERGRRENGALVTDSVAVTATTVTPTQIRLSFSGDQTVAGALGDGHYRLVLDGTKIRSAASGDAFDGAGVGAASGLTFGEQALDKFFSLYADANGDGVVDGRDIGSYLNAFRKAPGEGYNRALDYNDDGVVDGRDLGPFVSNFRTGLISPWD